MSTVRQRAIATGAREAAARAALEAPSQRPSRPPRRPASTGIDPLVNAFQNETPQKGNQTMTINNPSIEAWLNRHDAHYELVELPVEDINIAASLNNQVRHDAIDAEHLDEMFIAAKNGAIFPPIIIRRSDGIVLDGNHRVAVATKNGQRSVPAYVVDCTMSVGRTIAMAANRTNGKPNTDDELRQHVVDLLNMPGWNQSKVAAHMNMTAGTVRGIAQANKAIIRLNLPKIETKLARTSIIRLNSIRSDAVYREAARLAVQHKLTTNEAGDLVTAIHDGDPETKQMADLRDFIDVVRPSGSNRKTPIKNSVRDLSTAIGKLCKIDPVQIGLEANGDVVEIVNRLQAARMKIDVIIKELV